MAAMTFGVWAIITGNSALLGGLTTVAGVVTLVLATVIATVGMITWGPRPRESQPDQAESVGFQALSSGSLRTFRRQVVGDIPREPTAFQPRAELLAELGRAGPGESIVHVLTGMPGAGKTQLAAGYARAALADGWRLVAWVNAENRTALLTGMAAVGDAVGLSDSSARRGTGEASWAVVRRLETDGDRCLIVFDNADDPAMLRPFVPAGAAQVLITSCRQPTDRPGISVPVDVFTAEEALAFLAGRTGLPDTVGAAAVAAELGHLPLALALAAAMIWEQRLTYDQYLERLRQFPTEKYLARWEDLLPPGAAEAVLLALDVLKSDDDAAVCTGMMEIMAVLADAGVRRDLLHSAGRMGILSRGGHRIEADWVNRALEELSHRSLLTFSLDGQTVIGHSLVTRVVRDGLARRKRMTVVCRAAAWALEARTQALAGSQDHLAVLDLPGQVTALLGNVTTLLDDTAIPAGEAEELARVSLRLRILALHHMIELGDDTQQAIRLGQSLTGDLERMLGPDHPDTLASRDDLATAYQDADRITEAIPLFEQVLAAREQALGPDHLDTLASRDSLATAYQDADRITEAIPLFEQVLAAREQALGPDHLDTLASRDSLATARWAAGRAAEAIPILEQGLAARERLLGYDHRSTLTSRNNLAAAYWATGRATEAIPLHKQVLATRVQTLGPDHPDTLVSQNNLAAAYRDTGRAAEAIRLFEQVLAARERVLGPDHPGTLTARDNLAIASSKRAKGPIR